MTDRLAREFANVLPQVLAALAVDDPRLGLEAALELLATLGFASNKGLGPASCELEYHGRRLSLVATRPGSEPESFDPALRAALQLGLMRAVEH
ncbi:MAG TPA: hypothetical protein VER04_07125, partial [Polyangiaceae bacterium]|nr:hypothetical protein [Polyangiaceae bacterium]